MENKLYLQTPKYWAMTPENKNLHSVTVYMPTEAMTY